MESLLISQNRQPSIYTDTRNIDSCSSQNSSQTSGESHHCGEMEFPRESPDLSRERLVGHSRALHSILSSSSDHQEHQIIDDDCSATDSTADTICATDDRRYLLETQTACDAFHAAEAMMLLACTPTENRQPAEVCPAHHSEAKGVQHTTRTAAQAISGSRQPRFSHDYQHQYPANTTVGSRPILRPNQPSIASSKFQKHARAIGRQYFPWTPILVKDRERCLRACRRFNRFFAEENVPSKLSSLLFRPIFQPSEPTQSPPFLGGKIGNNVTVAPYFMCEYGYNICIGDNVRIGQDCTINDASRVIIGNNCVLGPRVMILTELPTERRDRRVNHSSWHVQGVRIENDCWIGAGAIICAGVCIGEGSTVLEGTVVTKNVVPGDRVAGNPARGLQSQ
ncbi:maltose O-acetyltransferase [Verticillium dahliae]|nr:maltose O-acetyltransferase [Verticillium dahliae]